MLLSLNVLAAKVQVLFAHTHHQEDPAQHNLKTLAPSSMIFPI
jgi:hypothetical protein